MIYSSKFNIGEMVWMVRHERTSYIVPCTACKNTGTLSIEGQSYVCPKCRGQAAHAQRADTDKYYVYDSSRIGKIDIQDHPTKYDKEEANPKVTYMVESTGVGSGQIWDEDELFATEVGAQAFCDQRNGLLPKDEAELLPTPIDLYGRVVPETIA